MSFFNGRRSDGGGGPTWMSGLISGAGKVISSVFRSDSPSPSSSYCSSEEESTDVSSRDVSSRECDEQKQVSEVRCPKDQIEEKLEPDKDYNGRSLAIISEIDSKHAIEQLIMQETFSREEFNHLTKIIQSRVLTEDGLHKEILDRPTGNAIAFAGAWKSLNQAREAPETVSVSPSSLDAISPGFSGRRVLTSDLRHSAVMEVKKWLDDKRLATSSNNDQYTTCTLNTEMPRYDIEGEAGSPVDVAKSYMQSLPSWKSLPFCSNGIEKTPHTSTHLYKDRLSYENASHSSPSSKGVKRSYPDLGSRDTFHEIWNVRLKATETVSDTSKCKLIDSVPTNSAREACQTSASEKFIYDDSRNLSALETLDASASTSAVFCAENCQSVGPFALPYEIVEVSTPARLGSIISISRTPDSEEVVNAVQTTHATSSVATLPLRPNSAIATGPSAVIISDESQEMEELLQGKEDSLIPHPIRVQHYGDALESVTNYSQLAVPAGIKSAPSYVEAVTNTNEVNTSRRHRSTLNQIVSTAKRKKTVIGSDWCGNNQGEAGANESPIRSTGGLDIGQHIESKAKPNPSNSSENDRALVIYEGSRELSIETNENAPQLKKTNSSRVRARGGTLKKPVKDAMTETQPSSSRARGRKTVPRPRRGRGK